jgi:hypothetical protein
VSIIVIHIYLFAKGVPAAPAAASAYVCVCVCVYVCVYVCVCVCVCYVCVWRMAYVVWRMVYEVQYSTVSNLPHEASLLHSTTSTVRTVTPTLKDSKIVGE